MTAATLANLVAELEYRLTGSSRTDRLSDGLSDLIPDSETYVLALFDGLGASQLAHPRAGALRAAHRGTIDAPFPTTTTVSMATVATGTHPVSHGTIGHQMWVPGLDRVVNVLKWITPTGDQLDHDTSGWLPRPNLWERLTAAGVEPVTVQPAHFRDSPLTSALYRGARFESVYTDDERIDATVGLAKSRRRLVFVYFAEIDFAAHVGGQQSPMYADAVAGADRAWSAITNRLPWGAVMIGTADHGHVDFSEHEKVLIRDPIYDPLTFFGDPRALYVKGDPDLIDRLAVETGAHVVDRSEVRRRLGPGPAHPELDLRLPDALLEPPADRVLLPRTMDKRLTGYHGGATSAEREIPILVAG